MSGVDWERARTSIRALDSSAEIGGALSRAGDLRC
jgi:hypothetical protein